MTRAYRLSPRTRAVNWVFAAMTRARVGASYRHILTARGRATGRPDPTPVDVIEAAGHRWLIAGYGPRPHHAGLAVVAAKDDRLARRHPLPPRTGSARRTRRRSGRTRHRETGPAPRSIPSSR